MRGENIASHFLLTEHAGKYALCQAGSLQLWFLIIALALNRSLLNSVYFISSPVFTTLMAKETWLVHYLICILE